MRPPKSTPRADYRRQQSLRAKESASLSEKYRELKSLTVELDYLGVSGICRNSHLKYTVNPDHAKSVFRFDCPNDQCVGGDFDLSEVLAQAVAARRTTVTGEVRCQGWLSKSTIDKTHCHNLLRYKLTLAYGRRAEGKKGALQAV
ncbi:MAG: hypothetical protein AB1705_27305 [Verrucomicrobiota bacterium]